MVHMMEILLKANGVKNVKSDDLFVKFKAVTTPRSGKVKVPVEEKPVTKEERIKEANNFWKAFFTVHKMTKPKRK